MDRRTYRIAHKVARNRKTAGDIDRAISQHAMPRGTKGPAKNLARQLRQIWDQPGPRHLRFRLNDYKAQKARRIIRQRRLSTPAGWHGPEEVRDEDRSQRIWLVAAEYRFEYSKRVGSYWVGGAYLVGIDDGGEWAIRVPRDTQTVREAMAWAKPAQVDKAESEGRAIRRQGDIYFVRRKQGPSNFQALDGERHEPRRRRDGTWDVVHPEHRPLRLPRGEWTAYAMRQDVAGNNGD